MKLIVLPVQVVRSPSRIVTQTELLRVRFIDLEVSQLLRERKKMLTRFSARMRSGAGVEEGQLALRHDERRLVVMGAGDDTRRKPTARS